MKQSNLFHKWLIRYYSKYSINDLNNVDEISIVFSLIFTFIRNYKIIYLSTFAPDLLLRAVLWMMLK